ncbi:MAG TPA: XRE family transcriptional regulator [Longimicrobium sp.]|nr:XRE family transcriptional regulator [Longimicrobium sp.]
MPRINPGIARWARETAGLDVEEAARRVQIAPASLAAVENGETEPSRPLLARMSRQYHRPLVAFYLSAPPATASRGVDFRTIPKPDTDDEAVLDALLRDITARQGLLRAGLEFEDEAEPLPFVGSATVEAGVAALVARIRKQTGVDPETYRRTPSAEASFRLLRERVEAAGVYVVLASDLGSHHTALDMETFRGFALADPVAPFIIINERDSRAAWGFSLVHELAHVWLGATGVSGGGPPTGPIERFCNDVASEFLLPRAEVRELEVGRVRTVGAMAGRIEPFARARRVSRTMVAYGLMRESIISAAEYRDLAAHFKAQWQAGREVARGGGEEAAGGPSYYVLRRQRLGALVHTTGRLLASGALTATKAARVLGVRAGNVYPLITPSAP